MKTEKKTKKPSIGFKKQVELEKEKGRIRFIYNSNLISYASTIVKGIICQCLLILANLVLVIEGQQAGRYGLVLAIWAFAFSYFGQGFYSKGQDKKGNVSRIASIALSALSGLCLNIGFIYG